MKRTKRWEGVDFTRFTTDIAREMGVSTAYVAQARRKYAPGTLGILRKTYTIDGWAKNADWSLKNRELAAEVGRSIACVTLARHKHAPETVNPRGRPKVRRAALSS